MWCIALGPIRINTSFWNVFLGNFSIVQTGASCITKPLVRYMISDPNWSNLIRTWCRFFFERGSCMSVPKGSLHGENLVRRMLNPNWWFSLPFPTSLRCDSGLLYPWWCTSYVYYLWFDFMWFWYILIISSKKTGRQHLLRCKFTPRRVFRVPFMIFTQKKVPLGLTCQRLSNGHHAEEPPAGEHSFYHHFIALSLKGAKLVEIREELRSRSTTAEVIPSLPLVTVLLMIGVNETSNQSIFGLDKVSQPA